jgi:probable cell surface protein (leucine-rich repeat protein)
MKSFFTLGQRYAFLLFLLLSHTLHAAEKFNYNGITYTVSSSFYKTLETISGNDISGDVVLPDSILYKGETYSITKIGSNTFNDNTNLTGIHIPSSVTSIGRNAFWGCTGLTEISISSSVRSIDNNAFYGCTGLTEISIPSSVTDIGPCAFSSCSGLKKVIFPDSGKKIEIGDRAFEHCTCLQLVIIPSTLDPGYNKWTYGIFYKSKIDKLIIFSNFNPNYIKNLDKISHLFCKSTDISSAKRAFNGQVSPSNPYELIYDPLIRGVRFSLQPTNSELYANPEEITMKVSLYSIYSGTKMLEEMPVKPEEYITIKKLEIGTPYTLNLSWSNSEFDAKVSYDFKTKYPLIEPNIATTQTTLKINSISYESDETVAPTNRYVEIDGKRYDYEDKPILLEDLLPDTYCSVKYYADYNGKICSHSESAKTKEVFVYANLDLGPTSAVLKGYYNAGDASVENAYWKLGKNIVKEGETLEMSGLIPDKTYDLYQYVVTVKGGRTFSKACPFRTEKLQMEMLDPKCTSATTAIVAAKTNISDMEPNVGFQWKKYDAPATLKPSTGYAAVYDGVLEGQIKNLQTASYYNVRAFYKDSEDKYYYTDWVSFDPSDFSYFEPTVHTYPVQYAGTNSAILKGYALEGTDAIISQGFQYWTASNPTRTEEPSPDKIQTVTASGQVMTVVLEDLRPGTTYFYRAFVETASGIIHGDEQTFNTAGDSAIWEIEADGEDAEVIGYYDLWGQRHDNPCKGLNIVVYSNGKSKKMIIK